MSTKNRLSARAEQNRRAENAAATDRGYAKNGLSLYSRRNAHGIPGFVAGRKSEPRTLGKLIERNENGIAKLHRDLAHASDREECEKIRHNIGIKQKFLSKLLDERAAKFG